MFPDNRSEYLQERIDKLEIFFSCQLIRKLRETTHVTNQHGHSLIRLFAQANLRHISLTEHLDELLWHKTEVGIAQLRDFLNILSNRGCHHIESFTKLLHFIAGMDL